MTEPAPHGKYRPDIDGLRAIAVTSVVAFHVWPSVARGGFVGVDIFFVISGYLITQLLLREASGTGTVSLAEFYARRVRRLFPALAVVTLVTLVLGFIFLLPVAEQTQLARSARMTAVYLSNLYFRHSAADYFAGPSDQQPLLHTWSLGVEEQYYLIWPAVVILVCFVARKLGIGLRRVLLGCLVLITVGSFALSVRWVATNPPGAFFLLPSRAWELGIGALLAVALEGRARNPAAGNALTALGVAAALAAILVITGAMPFPGAVAMLPVGGAALCIAGGALDSPLANVVLGNRPMVAIGKVSYSWYLWHWPLLAIARARAMDEPNLLRDTSLALLALALAWATLRYVENPVRHRRPWPFARRRSTLVAGVAISAGLWAAGYAATIAAILRARSPQFAELTAVHDDRSPLASKCQTGKLPLRPQAECTLPARDTTREIVVWGDSHADRIVAPVAAFAAKAGIPLLQRTNRACPPLLGVAPGSGPTASACIRFNDAVVAELADLAKATQVTVVLDGRWPYYLGRESPAGLPGQRLDGADPGLDPAARFAAALDRTLTRLDSLGVRVVVVMPVPELHFSPAECRLRLPAARCAIPRTVATSYAAPAQQAITAVVGRHAGARAVDMFDRFCDATVCSPLLDGRLAYSDTHHLAYKAAASLVSALAPALDWATATR